MQVVPHEERRALLPHVAGHAAADGPPTLTLTTFAHVSGNVPYYARRGFRILDDGEITPGLRAIRPSYPLPRATGRPSPPARRVPSHARSEAQTTGDRKPRIAADLARGASRGIATPGDRWQLQPVRVAGSEHIRTGAPWVRALPGQPVPRVVGPCRLRPGPCRRER